MQKLNGWYYEFFRPGVTCDVLVYDGKKTLLCKRANNPYKGYWSLPGGFLEETETLKVCAIREVKEECGLTLSEDSLEFFDYHDFLCDPRGQSLNMFFTYDINKSYGTLITTDESSDFKFVDVSELKNFLIIPHHNLIIRKFHE